MAFGKKPINCKLGDLGKVRSMYSQANALTGKNCTTAVYRGSLAFMVPELTIEELSIASAGVVELKTVDLQKYEKSLKCAKMKKDLLSTHSLKPFLLITQDLNKIKKIPNTILQTLLSGKSVQNFSKKC